MRVYLIRHADPDYSVDGLTEDGVLEAEALAERMRLEDLTHLYVSPLGRAQQTAAPIAQATGLAAVTEDWTAEWGHLRLETRHGQRCMWDIDGEELRTGQLALNPMGWAAVPPLDNGDLQQTYDAMAQASDAFFARLGYQRIDARYRIDQPNTHRLAVVCHGGFGLSWLSHILGVPLPVMWSGFWLSPSSVTTILFDQRSDQYAVPRIIGLADTSHLFKAGRRPKPRGIKANFD